MSEHHFGVSKGRIRASVGHRIDRAAKRHGAEFIWANMPDGPRAWFTCPNLGAPFDRQTERAVWAELEAEWLAGSDGLLPACFRDAP